MELSKTREARPSQSKITDNTSPITDKTVVCIIGLGYVGLPLAQAFSKRFKVIGFDTNSSKIRELIQRNFDRSSVFTDDAKQIGQADFIIIAVPTPVTRSKEPDLSFVESAVEIIGQNMTKGTTVIFESAVYPGVTEEIVRPILEQSGFKCGKEYLKEGAEGSARVERLGA